MILSRTATVFIVGVAAERGTLDLAAVADFDLGDFAVELAAALEEILPPGRAADLAVLLAVAGAAFEPGVTPEAVFAAELSAGLALLLTVAGPAGELGAAAGLMVLLAVPGAALETGVAPEPGFAADLSAGLAVALDDAEPAGEFGTEPGADLGAVAAGLIAEEAAGFAGCACFGAAAPAEGA
jgi:hypothetical protein